MADSFRGAESKHMSAYAMPCNAMQSVAEDICTLVVYNISVLCGCDKVHAEL